MLLLNIKCLPGINVTEMMWTRPLACVRVFDPEYCSLPAVYYHQMNVETRVKSLLLRYEILEKLVT